MSVEVEEVEEWGFRGRGGRMYDGLSARIGRVRVGGRIKSAGVNWRIERKKQARHLYLAQNSFSRPCEST